LYWARDAIIVKEKEVEIWQLQEVDDVQEAENERDVLVL